MTVTEIVEKKRAHLFPCVYHYYKKPPLFVAASDVWMTDESGKTYLDCLSGVAVVNAGHCHPKIVAAIARQAATLDHCTTIYLTEPMFRLASRLAAIAPRGLDHAFFCASGSEANETALLLAQLATGRSGFLALSHGLHGRTKWAMSVTGLDMWRTDSNPLQGIHFLPRADCHRCAFEREPGRYAFPCVEAIERIIVDAGPENLAGLIAEPVQGNGGIVVPPDGYWQRVRALCDRFGLLLLFDEIQTGMNRTGTWFAAEHWECVPDIVTMAKALGNGMPIAVTLASGELARAYTRPGASTFGGNPVSCAAALATLDVHEQQGLGQRAREIGRALLERLAHAVKCNSHLAHLRGMGMMIGLEVVDTSGEPDAARCDHYLETLKDRGFLLGKTGPHRNVLTLLPPLTMQYAQAASVADAVARLA